MLALLCHFREVARGGGWQALARMPDRCGRLQLLSTLHTSLDHTVALPVALPGTVLVAFVEGLGVTFTEHLAGLATRIDPRYVLINGHPYRVPADSSGDGLVLGVPTDADYPRPFNFDMNPLTFSARIPGQRDRRVTVHLMTATIAKW